MQYKFILTYLFCFLFVAVAGSLSSAEIQFQYDDAGNRTSRKTITLRASAPGIRSATAGVADEEETAEALPVFTDRLSQAAILIYPNPTKGLLRVEINGGIAPVDLQLYDMSGRLLLQEPNVTTSAVLDLGNHPAGTYLLRLTSGTQKSEWKIIKE